MTAGELTKLAPQLLGSGAGALGWHRVRESRLRETPAALELRESYRLHTLHALLFRERIKKVFSLLRAEGIEPILIKGWANARLYPEAGLRPYGDVDLSVSREGYPRAVELLMNTLEGRQYLVDLHRGMGRLDPRPWEEFYARSKEVMLDGERVRVAAPEDHLRLLSVHMLEDGAWRPIQLCDIAALVESIGAEFDWDLCLGRDKRQARWVASSLLLARELLGARVWNAPAEVKRARLPRWLVPTVLRHWERPCIEDHRPPELIERTLRHPARLPKAALQRWPDPIGATIRLRGSFNRWPRLPFQVADYLLKNGNFLKRLPALLRARQ